MNASEKPSSAQWINVKDPTQNFEVALPLHATHMQFDLSLEKTEQLGKLEVYSAPIQKGLLVLCSLYLPHLSEKDLEAKHFEQLFYSVVIRRMFYQPKTFRNEQTFEAKKETLQGHPALHFSAIYKESQVLKKLAGVALLDNKNLYILFHLAADNHFNNDTLQKFIQSFHFTTKR